MKLVDRCASSSSDIKLLVLLKIYFKQTKVKYVDKIQLQPLSNITVFCGSRKSAFSWLTYVHAHTRTHIYIKHIK